MNMNNDTPNKPSHEDQPRRTTSPRVDGKRPRMKPRAMSAEEHVRQETAPVFSTHLVEASEQAKAVDDAPPAVIKP